MDGDSEKTPTGSNISQFVKDLITLADRLKIEKPVWVGVSMGGMILQHLAFEHPSRVKALVLVSTTDGAMILDQDLPSIGNPRTNAEVPQKILLESFPAGTNPQLYQPLLDRIPTWCEALTSMSMFNKHRHFMMAEDPEGFRRVLGEFLHSLKKYALLCLAPSPITTDTTGRPHRKFNRS